MFANTSRVGRSFLASRRPQYITSANQILNLEVWYTADTNVNVGGITSGSEVTAWLNGGGLSSHDWNSTGGARPEWYSNIQNGLGAVRFNSTTSGVPTGEDADNNERLTVNPVAYLQNLSGSTIALVFRTLSTASGTRYACSTDTNGFQWGQNGTQWIGGHAGATYTVDTLVADTNFHYVIMRFDGTATGNANRFQLRVDGYATTLTFSGTVGSATNATASYFFGGCTGTGPASTSNYWVGDIGELIIWTRTLGSSEYLAVEDYLGSKWAI